MYISIVFLTPVSHVLYNACNRYDEKPHMNNARNYTCNTCVKSENDVYVCMSSHIHVKHVFKLF